MLAFNMVNAQVDSIKYRKNTIRFNLSTFLIFNKKNIVFGYERVVNPHQSFSVNIGQKVFPKIIKTRDTDIVLTDQINSRGFHTAIDYRFYLKNENKYLAPRGVYIGPYYSYNGFKFDTHVARKDGDVIVNEFLASTNINLHSLGFQLGYQFVFAKRFSLDLILIGPSITRYSLSSQLKGTFTPADRDEFYDQLVKLILDKSPWLKEFLEEKEIERTGSVSTSTLGLRYIIHIGYRF